MVVGGRGRSGRGGIDEKWWEEEKERDAKRKSGGEIRRCKLAERHPDSTGRDIERKREREREREMGEIQRERQRGRDNRGSR